MRVAKSVSAWFERALLDFALTCTPGNSYVFAARQASSAERDEEQASELQEWCPHLWLVPHSPIDGTKPVTARCIVRSRADTPMRADEEFGASAYVERWKRRVASVVADVPLDELDSPPRCPLCQLRIPPIPGSEDYSFNSCSECVDGFSCLDSGEEVSQ